MVATLILISIICMIILLYKVIRPGVMRYILPFVLSILYGSLLYMLVFFINFYLFLVLCALPLIFLIFILLKKIKNT